MEKKNELTVMQSIQKATKTFGDGIPQKDIDFVDGIVEKLTKGDPLDQKEQEFVDRNTKSVFG